jgi:Ca2+-binding RTX toxin-like protein
MAITAVAAIPDTIVENRNPDLWEGLVTLSGSVLDVRLTGRDAPHFTTSIDAAGSMVTIRPSAPFDAEAFGFQGYGLFGAHRFEFGLSVRTPTGWQTIAETWRVSLINVDDTPPMNLRFSSGGSLNANDRAGHVGILIADDPDTLGRLEIQVIGPAAEIFEIQGTALRLRANVSVAHLVGSTVDLTVEASDGRNAALFVLRVPIEPTVREGGMGADSLVGSDGFDSMLGNGGDDSLSGDGSADTLIGGSGADHLLGGAGHDQIVGDDGNDMIFAGDGDDAASGAEGQDVLDGGAGADSLVGGMQNDTLLGGTGSDTLSGDQGADHLQGGDDADLLFGGGNEDTLNGGGGDDTLLGGQGNDLLDAGDGRNLLAGELGADTIIGGGNTDLIVGGDDDDIIKGGGGPDILAGNNGNDFILGGDDRDFIFGNDGNDFLDGGAGNDTISGGNGADTLLGGDGSDRLDGGTGNDLLALGSGPKGEMRGGNGDDTLDATAAREGGTLLMGGSGDDLYSIASTADKIIEDKDDGIDTVFIYCQNTTFALPMNIEIGIIISEGNIIYGNYLDNNIVGSYGRDTIDGKRGNDTFHGGPGVDMFVVGQGSDVILDFDPGTDILKIKSSPFKDPLSVISSFQYHQDGIFLEYGSHSVLLKGVGITVLSTRDIVL